VSWLQPVNDRYNSMGITDRANRECPESTLKSHSWPRQQNRRVGRQADIQGGDGMP